MTRKKKPRKIPVTQNPVDAHSPMDGDTTAIVSLENPKPATSCGNPECTFDTTFQYPSNSENGTGVITFCGNTVEVVAMFYRRNGIPQCKIGVSVNGAPSIWDSVECGPVRFKRQTEEDPEPTTGTTEFVFPISAPPYTEVRVNIIFTQTHSV